MNEQKRPIDPIPKMRVDPQIWGEAERMAVLLGVEGPRQAIEAVWRKYSPDLRMMLEDDLIKNIFRNEQSEGLGDK